MFVYIVVLSNGRVLLVLLNSLVSQWNTRFYRFHCVISLPITRNESPTDVAHKISIHVCIHAQSEQNNESNLTKNLTIASTRMLYMTVYSYKAKYLSDSPGKRRSSEQVCFRFHIYICYGIESNRADASPDGKRLLPPVSTRNIRGGKCVAALSRRSALFKFVFNYHTICLKIAI